MILRKSDELLIHKEIFLSLTSYVYSTCALDAGDIFHWSCVFSTSKGQANDLVLGRSVTTENGCTVPYEPPTKCSGSLLTLGCVVSLV